MNYTAAKQFTSPYDALPGNAGEAGVPWEPEGGSSMARHDTWLLSFIDILALLLTLFVLLLAFQDEEIKSAAAVPHTVGESSPEFGVSLDVMGLLFQQRLPVLADVSTSKGFAMPGEGLLPVDTTATLPDIGSEAPAVPVTQPVAENVEALPEVPELSEIAVEDEFITDEEVSLDVPSQTIPGVNDALQASKNTVDALLEALEDSKLSDRVDVVVHPGEVNLEISDSILFSRGSAALTDEGRMLLVDLGEALSEQPYTLSVEGHTDNIPIETSRYPSNWELSSVRAAVVTRKLIEQGIAPDMVRAIGYGETRPLAENNTSEGRARNRRVSFVLQVDVKEGDL